ncbi:MAG: hypothetical protein KDK99_21645, partial [Verrucomicrobiales bacterium]|nr:hypothetical protein [Verrucomicrobiales bacterium]
IAIWIQLLEAGECSLDDTEFYLVTNQRVNSGIASILMRPANERDKKALVKAIRAALKGPPESWSASAAVVSAMPDAKLILFLDRITVATSPYGGEDGSLAHFATRLNLPEKIARPVMEDLRGWVGTIVQQHLLARVKASNTETTLPTFIGVEDFREQLTRVKGRHFDDRLTLRAAEDILVDAREKDSARSERFVRQLQIIDFDKDDVENLVDAITDFLRSKDERTRLAVANGVTKKDYQRYKTELIDHWKIKRRSAIRAGLTSEAHTGQEVLDRCLEFRPKLADQDVSEGYLSRGTYHDLANSTHSGVGWHPRFSELLGDKQA